MKTSERIWTLDQMKDSARRLLDSPIAGADPLHVARVCHFVIRLCEHVKNGDERYGDLFARETPK